MAVKLETRHRSLLLLFSPISKSGQQAITPLLSGVPEEQQVTAGASIRDGDRVDHASHRPNQPPIDVENEVQK